MIRIQKLIAQAGIASRRRAEELIVEKKVTVNGKIAKLGDKATLQDKILVENVPLTDKEDFVYYVINKPDKVICSLKDPQKRTIITELIKEPRRIFTVGRLDYDTTGTLLLTNDGQLAHRLTHPSYEIVRVYRARITKILNEDELKKLNGEVIINESISKQKVSRIDNKSYIIVLHQGTYHHIKKLFELVEAKVLKLTRLEYAGISHVGKLKLGEYRKLTIKEIRWLKQLTGLI